MLSESSDYRSLVYLGKMERQIDNLTVLINSLLDVAKIHIGKLEQRQEPFSLPQLVRDTVETLRPTFKSHNIVVKNLDNDKVFLVNADRDRINQVLINLINNAVKYSPKSTKVVVGVKVKKDQLIVSVKDYGFGVSKENQRKIFERYFRAKEHVAKSAPGLGIGLYISHQIIKGNSGQMWVESMGKGSTFYFSLPLILQHPLTGNS